MLKIPNHLIQVPPGQTTAREADGALRGMQRAGQEAAAAEAQTMSAGGGDQITLSPQAEALSGILGGNPDQLAAAQSGMGGLISPEDRDTLNAIVTEYAEANEASPDEIADATLWLQEQAVTERFLENDGSEETVLTGSLMERITGEGGPATSAPEGLVAAMEEHFASS